MPAEPGTLWNFHDIFASESSSPRQVKLLWHLQAPAGAWCSTAGPCSTSPGLLTAPVLTSHSLKQGTKDSQKKIMWFVPFCNEKKANLLGMMVSPYCLDNYNYPCLWLPTPLLVGGLSCLTQCHLAGVGWKGRRDCQSSQLVAAQSMCNKPFCWMWKVLTYLSKIHLFGATPPKVS